MFTTFYFNIDKYTKDREFHIRTYFKCVLPLTAITDNSTILRKVDALTTNSHDCNDKKSYQ